MAGIAWLPDVPQPSLLQQLAVGHHAPQNRSHTYATTPLLLPVLGMMHSLGIVCHAFSRVKA